MHITQTDLEAFLGHLRATGSPRAAADAVGYSLAKMQRARQLMESFAVEWDEIMAEMITELEAKSLRRAIEGYEKPVYQQGVEVGTVTEYSDSLVQFFLKAHKPAVYRDKQEVTHKGAVGLQVITGLPSAIDDLL